MCVIGNTKHSLNARESSNTSNNPVKTRTLFINSYKYDQLLDFVRSRPVFSTPPNFDN
ncbi:hypothetical protein BCEN4_760011 [Burkholderia cenocepacia]|nr:hypothetical protein BCEN4_760011 [Burkholderia cenocepacia]